MSTNLQAALDFGLSTIDTASAIARASLRAGGVVEMKDDGTPQAPADRAINEFIKSAVEGQRRGRRPAEIFVGEENTDPLKSWVVDPFDGSWLIARGVAMGAISMAFTHNGKPVVGIVRNPFTDETFWAIEGGPAYLNGAVVRVNDNMHVDKSVFTVPGCKVKSLNAGALISEIIDHGGDIITTGSVVCDAMLVVMGFAAAHVYPYSSPWDMAAVEVIGAGAGATITGLHGGKNSYGGSIDGAVVTNGRLHQTVLGMVRRHMPM